VPTGQSRQNQAWGWRDASRILLLCIISAAWTVAAQPRPATHFANLPTEAGFGGDRKQRPDSARHFQNIHAQGRHALVGDLRFTHLTTNDVLPPWVVESRLRLQDRVHKRKNNNHWP